MNWGARAAHYYRTVGPRQLNPAFRYLCGERKEKNTG